MFLTKLFTLTHFAITGSVFAAPLQEHVAKDVSDSTSDSNPQRGVVDVFYAHSLGLETVDLSKTPDNAPSETVACLTTQIPTQQLRSSMTSLSENTIVSPPSVARSSDFITPESVPSPSTDSGPNGSNPDDKRPAYFIRRCIPVMIGKASGSGSARKTGLGANATKKKVSAGGSSMKTSVSATAAATTDASEGSEALTVGFTAASGFTATKTQASNPAATAGGSGSDGENITIVIEVTQAPSSSSAVVSPSPSQGPSPSPSTVTSTADTSSTSIGAVLFKALWALIVLVIAGVLSTVAQRCRALGYGETVNDVWDFVHGVLQCMGGSSYSLLGS